MRWVSKGTEEGTRRKIKKFAWFPTSLHDPEDEWVWLEWYHSNQIYDAKFQWITVWRYK